MRTWWRARPARIVALSMPLDRNRPTGTSLRKCSSMLSIKARSRRRSAFDSRMRSGPVAGGAREWFRGRGDFSVDDADQLAGEHALDIGEDGAAADGKLHLQHFGAGLRENVAAARPPASSACGSEAKAMPPAILAV